jgi:selenium-binding protein 1
MPADSCACAWPCSHLWFRKGPGWDWTARGPSTYQPRLNVMVSSEWAAPNTIRPGFKLADVRAGKYGHRLHFWDWKRRTIAQSIDLGEEGKIPLEVRFHHNPDSSHGFVGAALSSAIWHWQQKGDQWVAQKTVQVDPVEVEGWPFPVPGPITDLVLSLDDRWLAFRYFCQRKMRNGGMFQSSRSTVAGPKMGRQSASTLSRN